MWLALAFADPVADYVLPKGGEYGPIRPVEALGRADVAWEVVDDSIPDAAADLPLNIPPRNHPDHGFYRVVWSASGTRSQQPHPPLVLDGIVVDRVRFPF